jgi:hypothetical protein
VNTKALATVPRQTHPPTEVGGTADEVEVAAGVAGIGVPFEVTDLDS